MLAYIFIFFGVKTTPLKKSTSVNSPKSTLGSDTLKSTEQLRYHTHNKKVFQNSELPHVQMISKDGGFPHK